MSPTLLLIQPTSESSKMTTDTIVAQATAPGRGAVGIVRVSSAQDLTPLIEQICGRALRPREAHYLPLRAANGAWHCALAALLIFSHFYTFALTITLSSTGDLWPSGLASGTPATALTRGGFGIGLNLGVIILDRFGCDFGEHGLQPLDLGRAALFGEALADAVERVGHQGLDVEEADAPGQEGREIGRAHV